MIEAQIALCLLLIGLIALFSLLEMAALRLSRVALRVIAEREAGTISTMLEKVARDRVRFLFPLQMAVVILTTGFAVVVTLLMIDLGVASAGLAAFGTVSTCIVVFRHLIPRRVAQRSAERVLLVLLKLLSGSYRALAWIASPLQSLIVRGPYPDSPHADDHDEASEEEIQAYLDVGEEEGIFEEEESDLIQSALEFGSTLAREIMTPRSRIVSLPDTATVADLKKLMATTRHSRVPIYRGQKEHFIGTVYVRNLLTLLEEGGTDDEPITSLVKEPWFVPETKRVAELLKEMQRKSEPLALVVSEYGSVIGLVSIEDLLEEIVGEIHDEDESRVVDISQESPGRFLVRGELEVNTLEKATGVDLGDHDVTTVSGLIVDHLGRVPAAGEETLFGALHFQILESDGKTIDRMRVWSVGAMPPAASAAGENDPPLAMDDDD